MFGLIFIDSFFVCVTCFPCCKMSMFFPHVPKVPLPIHITPHEIIIHCFKTNILFCIPMSLAKKRTKHVFFLCALYLCSKMISYTCISSVQLLSHIWLFATPWTAAHQASQSITNSRSLLKLMSIKSVMPSNHVILCRPLLLPPSIFLSIKSHFQMSQFFASGGQSIGVSASGSVLTMNIQHWFPLLLIVWSPCSPRDSQESSPIPQFKSINSGGGPKMAEE